MHVGICLLPTIFDSECGLFEFLEVGVSLAEAYLLNRMGTQEYF